MWSKRNPSALLVGMQTGKATGKTVWSFFQKLKVELPFDPAIPLLGLYPKNPESPIRKNTCTLMFIAALFTIAKTGNTDRVPISRGVDKKDVIHLHNGMLCACNK